MRHMQPALCSSPTMRAINEIERRGCKAVRKMKISCLRIPRGKEAIALDVRARRLSRIRIGGALPCVGRKLPPNSRGQVRFQVEIVITCPTFGNDGRGTARSMDSYDDG